MRRTTVSYTMLYEANQDQSIAMTQGQPARPKSTPELIDLLREGTRHLSRMAEELDTAWDPTPQQDPRLVHNMYVRNLVASYASRFSELSNGVLTALKGGDFLVYALCGRALIETTATLRYYVTRKYKPLLDRKSLDEARWPS